MTSKRIKNERGGYSVVKREMPEEDNDSCCDFKITVKAHFQIAQPKIDDPASFRFKAKSGGGVQKINVASNKFKCMEDVFVIIKQLSDRDAKCGSFDVHSPKPIRILSFSAFDSKFTMTNLISLKIFYIFSTIRLSNLLFWKNRLHVEKSSILVISKSPQSAVLFFISNQQQQQQQQQQ